MRSRNYCSVSAQMERFEERCKRWGVWLARPSWDCRTGGNEMTKQDEKRCPCRGCAYQCCNYGDVDGDPDDAIADCAWFIIGKFPSGSYQSEYPPTCADGKDRCPFCFAELKGGECGPSAEQIEAQRDALAQKLCWEHCPNSGTYPTKWWSGCKYATRGDRERECGSAQTLACWLKWSAEKAEV